MIFGKKKTKKKALLVGINYKGTNSELRGCINDVKNIKNVLLKNGFKEKNIIVLTEESGILPTKQNIGRYLYWLIENKKNKKMNIFFHYSGHGSYMKDNNKDEEDGRDECLVPLDYRQKGMIRDDELKLILSKRLTSNTKMFSIIDSCHSGTMFDLKYNLNCNNFKKELNDIKINFQINIDKYKDNIEGEVYVLSGCEDNQTSADAYLERKPQGALTYAFLNVIRENKKLTQQEFITEIYKVIKRYNFNQNPSFSSNKTIIMENIFEI